MQLFDQLQNLQQKTPGVNKRNKPLRVWSKQHLFDINQQYYFSMS